MPYLSPTTEGHILTVVRRAVDSSAYVRNVQSIDDLVTLGPDAIESLIQYVELEWLFQPRPQDVEFYGEEILVLLSLLPPERSHLPWWPLDRKLRSICGPLRIYAPEELHLESRLYSATIVGVRAESAIVTANHTLVRVTYGGRYEEELPLSSIRLIPEGELETLRGLEADPTADWLRTSYEGAQDDMTLIREVYRRLAAREL